MKLPDRQSIRLRGFDYSSNGLYFVTICVQDKIELFGKIVGARRDEPKMILNKNGEIVESIWKSLSDHHPVILDEFCIMPDHIHFILGINNKNMRQSKNNNAGGFNNENTGVSRHARTLIQLNSCHARTLGWIIGIFKTMCTKNINELNGAMGKRIFQRNYYERIIRNEKEYFVVKKYIRNNPKNWKKSKP